MGERRRQAGGLFVATLLGTGLVGVATARAQFFVPEAGTTGAGSFPSDRAAAAAADRGDAPLEPATSPLIRQSPQGFLVGIPPGDPAVDTRRIRFTPSLTGQIIATDNVNGTSSNRKADVIATVSPGIFVNADTPRLSALINYQPTAFFYLGGNAPNQLTHFGNGQALLTVIPERLFLDVRGFASVQSLTGGQSTQSAVLTNSGQAVQSQSFIVSPYYVHRFGTFATARVGYTFQQATQSLGGTFNNDNTISRDAAARNGFQNTDFTAHQVYAIARTGPDFGRVALEGILDSTNYVGNGVLDGAYRRSATLQGRYAITREVSVLAEGGWEQQRYSGDPGFRLSGPIYSIGVRLDPSANSFLIARYGRRDGFNSASLDASMAIGVRTRLVARYAERLTTSAGRATDLLTTTTLDDLGNPIDLATGLPAASAISTSGLGIQSNLLRVKTGVATIVQQWPRDTISLSVLYEDQAVVSTARGVAPVPQRSISGSVAWARSLSDRTTGTALLQYGKVESTTVSNGDFATASLSFQHQLQERLSGTLQIATTLRSNAQGLGQGSGRAVQNFLLVGLRQTF